MNRSVALFCMLSIAAATARSQPVTPESPATTPAASATPRSNEVQSVRDRDERERLRALKPSDPAEYLELAEELLDTPDSPERVALTRELLIRALEYGRTQPGHRRTAASAAIALASMSTQDGDRLWLRSIAAILEPSSADFSLSRRAREQESIAAAARASQFLTQLRAGAGIEARDSLAAKGVRRILEEHARELSARGTISVQDLENESKKLPCFDCAGTGMIAPPKGQRGPARICPVCGGQPGIKLSAPDLAAQLRLQRRLAGSFDEPWGSLIVTEGDGPARDPDPADVAVAFAVDVRLPFWRDGQWVSAEAATPAQP
ncbi:MAG: hypothetical protein KF691_09910 [Phycisphaeraceae bacterium]|nr:hypothetical protein [Phycisphaeraceae bacterium]